MRSLSERVSEKTELIPFHPCHEWIGLQDKNGYGLLKYGGRNVRIHRIVLAWKLGRQLSSGEMSLHRCDNPSCVNPEHLFSGSALDNMRDKVSKGRMIGPCADNKSKKFCDAGHEFNKSNTYYRPNGRRDCRICHRQQVREASFLKKHGRPRDASVCSNGKKTHCPSGHEYSPDNIYRRSNGGRSCRICTIAQARAYRARKKTRA